MSDYYSYLEDEFDDRPFMESEMQDPTNEADEEYNYEPEEVDDSYWDQDTFTSIGWGTDEDYHCFGEDSLW
tara:strand:+ start:805 stop:1017 length:213 start_codon:yes stop_codon:yes gene_type:complete